jgi:NAD(P)-dependent dehydrogenase (short-subunit alcohol dehydrogenase family)
VGTYPELKGKAAIVTGATAGIGKTIAQCLAEEGVDVVVVGRDEERGTALAKALGDLGTASYFARCDVTSAAVTSAAAVEATCQEALRRFGRADILINCAGGFPRPARLEEYTVADWDDMMSANLRSVFLFTRQLLPGMVERRWGRVVSISSVAAQSVPYLTSALYAAAKAGMLGFTRHVAAEVAPFGVTVNATAPGLTNSERIARMGDANPGLIAERLSSIRMGRLSEPIEQARLVLFLCSDQASYITGATVPINGGLAIL